MDTWDIADSSVLEKIGGGGMGVAVAYARRLTGTQKP